jgi:hypothetical protein
VQVALKVAMQLLGAISIDEVNDLSVFTFSRGNRPHLLLPLVFFALVLVVIFGWEYYREWKKRRRLRRYWTGKPGPRRK